MEDNIHKKFIVRFRKSLDEIRELNQKLWIICSGLVNCYVIPLKTLRG
jgi:hypothetical protein